MHIIGPLDRFSRQYTNHSVQSLFGCRIVEYNMLRIFAEVFTALHGMQTRSSDENSVRLSVCLCLCLFCQTRGLRQNGRKIDPHLYTVRKIIYLCFLRRRMVGGERPPLHEILGQPAPVGATSPIFNRYSLAAPQLQHLAKKSSINTNRKSITRFQMSLR